MAASQRLTFAYPLPPTGGLAVARVNVFSEPSGAFTETFGTSGFVSFSASLPLSSVVEERPGIRFGTFRRAPGGT